MLSQLTRAVTMFLAVLAAYTAYRLLAVPLIEPSIQQRASQVLAPRNANGVSRSSQRLAELRKLFPKGAWELDDPIILETESGTMLIQDYTSLSDGRLELKPCTLIMQTASDSSPDQADRIILQAAQNAILKFDRPLDLTKGEIGRLEGGVLNGPVTIRRLETQPGAGDDVEIWTQQVQITRQQIVAPGQVRFRYGKNTGSGRKLIVRLDLPAADQGPRRTGSPAAAQLGSLASLELVHLDRLDLQTDSQPSFGGTDRVRSSSADATPLKVQVTCQGAFQYLFKKQVATLHDQVQVVRPRPNGPPDRLDCDVLRIYFARTNSTPDAGDGDPMASAGLSGMRLQRIEAIGMPAVLEAPSYSAAARGETLEYDFQNNRIRIDDQRSSFLRYEDTQIATRRLEYEFGAAGRLGRLSADGPGKIHGTMPQSPGKTFEAHWDGRVILQPHDDAHALSLLDGAHLLVHGEGEFSAGKIHLWLRETASTVPGSNKVRYQYAPLRLLAEENVDVDSWQLSGKTQRAEVWIREAAATAVATRDPASANSNGRPDGSPKTVTGQTPDATATDSAKSKLDVRSDGVQVQLVRGENKTQVEHLILSGQVQLREIQTQKPTDVPLLVTGQVLEVRHVNKPAMRMLVQGEPANVAARGMGIRGAEIQLRRAENRMWVVGPGTMTLAATQKGRSHATTPVEPPVEPSSKQPMTIQWTGGMNFDGRMATFDRDVQVRSANQTSQGETMDLLVIGQHLTATLTQRVSMNGDKPPADLDLQRLAFQGAVFLKNQTRQGGRQTSFDQMNVRDLTIDQTTGRLHADGPGWGSSVRFQKSISQSINRGPRTETASSSTELAFVRIDFEDEIVGNTKERELEFRGFVRTLYGPVASWEQTLDPELPNGLAKEQFLLSSQRLLLADMGKHVGPQRDGETDAVELIAEGNASIEGEQFTARGQRISYAQAKRLLILEGDGRRDAELWRRGSTTPDAASQVIRYWTQDQSIHVDGGRFLDLSRIGALSR